MPHLKAVPQNTEWRPWATPTQRIQLGCVFIGQVSYLRTQEASVKKLWGRENNSQTASWMGHGHGKVLDDNAWHFHNWWPSIIKNFSQQRWSILDSDWLPVIINKRVQMGRFMTINNHTMWEIACVSWFWCFCYKNKSHTVCHCLYSYW